MKSKLSPTEQIALREELAVREELEATLAEIQTQIETELAKLLPLLGDEATAILAMELEVNPANLRSLTGGHRA
jgi:hypothetical protein